MAYYEVRGMASTDDLDAVRDIVPSSAFRATLARRGLTGPKGVRLLAFHDSRLIVGKLTRAEIRNNGLYVEGLVNDEIDAGRNLIHQIKDAGGLSFSIGYRIEEASIVTAPDGQEAICLDAIDLHEISIVPFPCNSEAAMTSHGKHDPIAAIRANIARLKAEACGNDPVVEALASIRRLKQLASSI